MIGYIGAFAVLLLTLVLPETGVGGVCNEAAVELLFLIIAVYVGFTVFHKRKEHDKKAIALGVVVSFFFLAISVRGFWNIGADLLSGPETTQLTSVTRYQFTGIRGVISQRYSLDGYNEDGKWLQFPIAGSEYRLFENVEEIQVTYYPRMKRILEFGE